MCGRYAQGRAIPEVVARYAHLGGLQIASEQLLHPAFNIAPSMAAAVVTREGAGACLQPMQWGLVPHWAKSLAALKSRPINARSETADAKPMFRDAFRRGRCLVPATGFYEWQGSKAPKQPYFIQARDQETLSFAALYAVWKGADDGPLLSFAILTTDANDVVKPIHDRMPCILRPEEEDAWLDENASPDVCKELLRPYPAEATSAHPVSTQVNKPGPSSPDLMAPVEPLSENHDFLF